MNRPGSILRQSSDGWQIASLAEKAEHGWQTVYQGVADMRKFDPSACAAAVAKFVTNHDLSSNVFLALDSTSAMSVKFTLTNDRELRDRQALSYRVEELLPIAAEDFEFDFVAEDNEVLAIATQSGVLLPLLRSLEGHGLNVQSISPLALIGLQAYLKEKEHAPADLIAWQDGASIQLFEVSNRSLKNWWHLPSEPASVQQHIAAMLLRKNHQASAAEPNPRRTDRTGIRVTMLNVAAGVTSALEHVPNIETKVVQSKPLAEHARRGAARVLRGRLQPWCELLRDSFIIGDRYRGLRHELNWFQLSLACLLLVASTYFFVRSRQFDHLASVATRQQRTLFQEVFPNSRVPNAIVARLKSEQAKLTGAIGSETAIDQPSSALHVLFEILAALPEEIRIQIAQLRIEDGSFFLDVRTLSIGGASKLTDAFERRGFSIEPPTTEQLDGQVAVRVQGKMTLSQWTGFTRETQRPADERLGEGTENPR